MGQESRGEAVPPGVGGGEKILLVDDEPAIRVLLARQLSRLGFTPVEAATGEEALALCQRDTFRVVIADLEMSGLGGLPLLRRLSPLQPQARFLVLTGRGSVEGESLPRGHRVRMFGKPWDERELAAAVTGSDNGVSASQLAPAPQRWPKTKVLLIEADEAWAQTFCDELDSRHQAEFCLSVAADLPTACSLLEHHSFDVMALTVSATDFSALEAIARLQGEAPHIGIVVITQSDEPQFSERAIQAGAQECLASVAGAMTEFGRALRQAMERKRAEWRLARIALHDPLTGLANRCLFRQRVAQAAAFAKRSRGTFAVLVLDIDRFKFINDSLGHDAGDAFLQEVARRLQGATRETDTVARFGADEFAVLATPLASTDDIECISQRVLTELRRPIGIEGALLHPAASVGAALFPASGQDGDALLTAADAARRVVKESGCDGVHVHGRELEQQAARRLKLEELVRRAVPKQGFCLRFQPQLSLVTRFLGAQALLCWSGPSELIAEPRELLRVLEDTGLILELGPWIIEQACHQLRRWRADGCRVDRMAINIPGRQLLARDFGACLQRVTSEAGLQCSDLELEFSEATLQHDQESLRAVFSELAAYGYRLALDDFGAAHCSLAQLRNFAFNTLKLEETFVQSLTSDRHERQLAGGIIRLADHLGLDVVAVGVETHDQLAVLSDEGCRVVQGYLLGAPMAGDEFRARAASLGFNQSDEAAAPPPS